MALWAKLGKVTEVRVHYITEIQPMHPYIEADRLLYRNILKQIVFMAVLQTNAFPLKYSSLSLFSLGKANLTYHSFKGYYF